MNERRRYYPVLAYTALLALVWVVSLGNDILQLFLDNTVGNTSLMSAGGVRWAVRNALPSIGAAPWGTIAVLLAVVGLLRGSGITGMLSHFFTTFRLTKSEWRSFLFSLLALIPYSVRVYMATVSPWNLLRSVTGDIAISPICQGWLVLLFFGVLFVSLVYGFIYGCYRSMLDAVVLAGETFSASVPALMAVVPASGIVPCLRYVGVFDYLGISADGMRLLEWGIYLLPFIYLVILHSCEKRK